MSQSAQAPRSAQRHPPGAALTAAQQRALVRKRLRADQNGVMAAGVLLAVSGWWLLARLVESAPPLAFPRWLFFILLYIAVTGSTLPFIGYLHRRFSRLNPPSGGVILRQGMWFGLLAVTLAWLQMTRALTLASAGFLILALLVIETFLRLRDRAA
ncbi:MAG: hypothetical protein CUN49_00895 [Candidatus Thermofonsia Clade 1 bacterium]|uniref:Uncharacterized protein n=1 Tax=Candidatus Thermofonsia Clade 1 bacterium TaxID=2364210 RepID=A0A2M8PIH0_9CHLR|nr:MAG: hypothetical protein CUN49_00895 [Candidatus Thermofonsia Clade 1 bacterium]RMF53970.1 MAG: hypothetical protein D6749_00880 [Chloroflexota bacterium]